MATQVSDRPATQDRVIVLKSAEETAGELVGGVSRLNLPRRAVRLLALAARRRGRGHLRLRALPMS